MGLLEIIEQKLKGEAEQMQAEIEKQSVGVKGGMSRLKRSKKKLIPRLKMSASAKNLMEVIDLL